MAESGRASRRRVRPAVKLGVPPGAPVYMGAGRAHPIRLHLVDYGPGHFREHREAPLDALGEGSAPGPVRWVDLDGVHDPDVIARVGGAFDLHPLWIEDVLNPTGRPKVEWLGDHLLVVLRVVPAGGSELDVEQVALVLGPRWVLSFQEKPGDAWEPVRRRLEEGLGPLRARGPDALLHALADVVVDRWFAVLQALDTRVDALEDETLGGAVEHTLLPRVAAIKTDVDLMRDALWPLREAVTTLIRGEGALIEDRTLPYFRDLGDHLGQLTDGVDDLRERLRGVVDVHLAMTSHRLNEVMRVLTIVSTVFIPLTFVAGVYGMNFAHMPELRWRYGYPLTLGLMAAVALGLLVFFRRKGWF